MNPPRLAKRTMWIRRVQSCIIIINEGLVGGLLGFVKTHLRWWGPDRIIVVVCNDMVSFGKSRVAYTPRLGRGWLVRNEMKRNNEKSATCFDLGRCDTVGIYPSDPSHSFCILTVVKETEIKIKVKTCFNWDWKQHLLCPQWPRRSFIHTIKILILFSRRCFSMASWEPVTWWHSHAPIFSNIQSTRWHYSTSWSFLSTNSDQNFLSQSIFCYTQI